MPASEDEHRGSSPGPPTDLPPNLQQALLAASLRLSGQLELDALVRELRGVLAALTGLARGGLCIYDHPRELLISYVFRPAPATPRSGDADHVVLEEALDADSLALLDTLREIRLDNPRAREQTDLARRLADAGVRRLMLAPLRLQDRKLGVLFAGFGEHVSDLPVQRFLASLARLATPVLWNCHTETRFRHGDRRRDMLIELSDAINHSLELNAVLDSARQAIRQLEGHCYSSVDLLDEDRTSFRRYPTYAARPPEPAASLAPEPRPLAGTVLEWVIEHQQTYKSAALSDGPAFEHDTVLRDEGVRRYIATPLIVRGRIIGCFLMGMVDPHPVLPIDVWLYENIALQLALAIDNARQLLNVQQLSERIAQQNVYLREEIQSEHDFAEMVGNSPAMQRVRAAIQRVAPTDTTVLITGETGVGKELVARALHAASRRADQPMVKVNCAAIPEGMVESELFGHERGAFTSAIEQRIGRFELARDGTLFLDEVGELPAGIQAKLLRVLQDGQFERVGGTRTLISNARIIAATNRDLARCVEERTFRQDLYYRLNVFPIYVAPLRERREDIPLLANAFLQQCARRMGKPVDSIAPETLAELEHRHWPGNIRELRHVIERALILCDDPRLTIAPTESRVPPPTPGTPPEQLRSLADVEAAHIRRVLQQTSGVIEGPRGAARILGLKPSTLRFRMRRLGVSRPEHAQGTAPEPRGTTST